MSNSFSGENWTITSAQSAAICTSGGINIVSAKWYPNATDNDLLVVDSNSAVIIKSRAKVPAGANNEEIGAIDFEEARGHHDGFKVATIDGGTLYVKIK